MIRMIAELIANGHAYAAEGHVLFHVASMPDYGKLSNRSLDDMIAGARVEVAPYKRDPMDFVLWKPSKRGEPSWPSPWSNGRPGWHIECSAMAGALLGNTFDIHGGGIDLIFPHHENEIAQSRCAHGTSVMANYWLHNGFLQVEGEKMSKSLGNFVTIRELRQGWGGYPWPGESLRFNMLRTQYTKPLDWTVDSLDVSHKTLWGWYEALDRVAPSEVPGVIYKTLEDDLNTPDMITELHGLHRKGDLPGLLASLLFLGFSGKTENILRIESKRVFAESGHYGMTGSATAMTLRGTFIPGDAHSSSHFTKEQIALFEARAAARARKDFAEADRLRAQLDAMGIALKDSKDPKTGELVTTWEVKR
jgi:cysteinyl-tRNA synthetase